MGEGKALTGNDVTAYFMKDRKLKGDRSLTRDRWGD